MLTHLTFKSNNAKTGPIPVSTSSGKTCPPSCPLKKVCYAKSGPLAMHWAKVTNEERGMEWADFLSAIKSLPEGQLWRHNQAGDLPGIGERVNASALSALTHANNGRKGYTYSHKYKTAENLAAIRKANAEGFTVNLSANTLAEADELVETDAGPVVVVLPSSQTRNTVTPAGRKVVVCPASIRDDVTCASCGLCQKQRSAIIGFPAHGTSARKASEIASAAEGSK